MRDDSGRRAPLSKRNSRMKTRCILDAPRTPALKPRSAATPRPRAAARRSAETKHERKHMWSSSPRASNGWSQTRSSRTASRTPRSRRKPASPETPHEHGRCDIAPVPVDEEPQLTWRTRRPRPRTIQSCARARWRTSAVGTSQRRARSGRSDRTSTARTWHGCRRDQGRQLPGRDQGFGRRRLPLDVQAVGSSRRRADARHPLQSHGCDTARGGHTAQRGRAAARERMDRGPPLLHSAECPFYVFACSHRIYIYTTNTARISL